MRRSRSQEQVKGLVSLCGNNAHNVPYDINMGGGWCCFLRGQRDETQHGGDETLERAATT